MFEPNVGMLVSSVLVYEGCPRSLNTCVCLCYPLGNERGRLVLGRSPQDYAVLGAVTNGVVKRHYDRASLDQPCFAYNLHMLSRGLLSFTCFY